jgi:LysR family glycine cleavage system transcriptional activator
MEGPMARLPPLNALRCFEAAARLQSFSRAAQELHVTQSAVSHQIRQLEQWFGASLFDRKGRQTVPTPRGEELAISLAEAFGTIAAACKRLSLSDGKPSITIAAIPSIATIWLIPRLPAFSRRHPMIGVRLMHAVYGQTVDFDDVDLAITYGNWREAPVGSVRFLEGVSVPVCSPAYLAQHGPISRPEQLLTCTLLHDLDRYPWQRWFKASGIADPGLLPGPMFEGFNLLHSALLSAQGVGLAPTAILADDIKERRLVRLFDVETLHEKAYYIMEPQVPRPSAVKAIETFKAWLLEEALTA